MSSRLFIGSSTENLDVAYAAQENLEHDLEVTVWSQGLFEPSKFTMESLLESLDEFDFGLFVFAPDDVTKLRDQTFQTVRDNVIFELGLFIGKLSRERCFIIIPRTNTDFHLPTDLLGLTPGTYEPNRQDKNLPAALGPACNKIRKVVVKQGSRVSTTENTLLTNADFDENDVISILESWMGARDTYANMRAIRYDNIDKELSLPPGSTKKYIKIAASRWDYIVHREGQQTIVFKEQ